MNPVKLVGVALAVALTVGGSSITSSSAQGGAEPATLASGQLLREAERELAAMKSSTYQHETSVLEKAGRFDYDCSGFLSYALRHTTPEAYEELPRSKSKRPLAQDFYAHFAGLEQASGHWTRVPRPIDLRPGDIVSWLRPPDNDSTNTGHVMLVRSSPSLNPKRSDEVLVPVIDSTTSPHANDTRPKGQTGLGSGVIGLMVDQSGAAVSYRWRGGVSKVEEVTPIALGRVQ